MRHRTWSRALRANGVRVQRHRVCSADRPSRQPAAQRSARSQRHVPGAAHRPAVEAGRSRSQTAGAVTAVWSLGLSVLHFPGRPCRGGWLLCTRRAAHDSADCTLKDAQPISTTASRRARPTKCAHAKDRILESRNLRCFALQ
jgi:hypothetical protein